MDVEHSRPWAQSQENHLADAALAEPLNGTIEVAGPEPIRQDDLVRQFLIAPGTHER
jgi:hypothetical protein